MYQDISVFKKGKKMLANMEFCPQDFLLNSIQNCCKDLLNLFSEFHQDKSSPKISGDSRKQFLRS